MARGGNGNGQGALGNNGGKKNTILEGLWHLWPFDTGLGTDASGGIDAGYQRNLGSQWQAAQQWFNDIGDYGPVMLGRFKAYAYNYDGTAEYNITKAASTRSASTHDVGTKFTVGAWVNCGTVAAARTILSKSSGGAADTNFWLMVQTTGFLQGRIYVAGVVKNVNGTTSIASDNKFHLAVFTYDGANLRIYLDGKQEGFLAESGTPTVTGDEIHIGRVNGAFGMLGRIAMPFIFRRPLTPAEIVRLYNNPGAIVGIEGVDEAGGPPPLFAHGLGVGGRPVSPALTSHSAIAA